MTTRHPHALALVFVLGTALTLRVLGIQYGLPAVYNPDEVAIVARALSFANGTLNPHNFLYPTFFFYALFAWIGAYLAIVWLTGGVDSLAALPRLYFTAPTAIYTAGRSLCVAAGTATVFAVYRLGIQLADSRTAIAAATFLAVAPLHVRDSHYVKHDVPATLAIVIAYVAMWKVWSASTPTVRRTREIVVAAVACGVAFSIHYYCVFLAIPLALAIVKGSAGQPAAAKWRRLLTAAAITAAVFFALSPFILLEPATAWRDIAANRQIVVDRAITAGAFAPALRYADMLWRDTMGVPVVALALVGMVWMLISTPSRALFLLAFPVPFLAFISNTAPASRYLNPVAPFLAIFAGWCLASLCARFGGPKVFWAGLVVFATPAAVTSLRTDLFFRVDDTRTVVQRFFEVTVPSGSTVLIQPYSVPLTPSREGLSEALAHNLGSGTTPSTKFRLQLSLDPYPQPAYRLIYLGRGGLDADKIYVDPSDLNRVAGLDVLRRLGVAFVVIKRYNDMDPDTAAFLAVLAEKGRRIAAFSPYRPGVTEAGQARIEPFLHNTDTRIDDALERPGPPLEIWQIDGPGS
jgi:Dolichyl-phosphate-mannose-protein mannosyltransferase